MQRARFWILCAMGALVVIAGILLFGTRYWAVSTQSLKNMLPANVDMRLDDLVLSESGEGNRRLTVKAASAQYFKTEDYFLLEDVRARVLADSGAYTITSDRGRYGQKGRVIELTGQARVVGDDGGVLVSDKLVLKFGEGLLISDDRFCYSTPTMDFSGASFVYHTKEKFLSAEGRTHVLFH